MKRSAIAAAFAAASFFLSACGGGSGGSGGSLPPPTGGATQMPATPGTTTAQGTLVDDPSGAPLAGITVRLDPWVTYPTPGPTPTPIAVSTTDAQGRFTVSAPNGTYMLVIGPDSVNTPPPGWTTPAPFATDTPVPGAAGWRATIHDRLVLTGQSTLLAPTLPSEPFYTPPAVELSGKYRLATLDPLYEAPCILAYNQKRVTLGLPPAVADQWLTENTRGIVNGERTASQTNSGGTAQFLTGGTGHMSNSGGANCANDLINGGNGVSFTGQSQALSPQALWFGGLYVVSPGTLISPFGAAENLIDPRFSDAVDPSVPLWP